MTEDASAYSVTLPSQEHFREDLNFRRSVGTAYEGSLHLWSYQWTHAIGVILKSSPTRLASHLCRPFVNFVFIEMMFAWNPVALFFLWKMMEVCWAWVGNLLSRARAFRGCIYHIVIAPSRLSLSRHSQTTLRRASVVVFCKLSNDNWQNKRLTRPLLLSNRSQNWLDQVVVLNFVQVPIVYP